MKGLQVALASVGALVGLIALIWVIQGNDFFLYKTFAPKYEEVRRETFEETKSYTQGTIQELQQLQLDYVKAGNQEEKDALASVILRRTADFDDSKLPDDLAAFVREIKVSKGIAR